jgi:hypothetical protein
VARDSREGEQVRGRPWFTFAPANPMLRKFTDREKFLIETNPEQKSSKRAPT